MQGFSLIQGVRDLGTPLGLRLAVPRDSAAKRASYGSSKMDSKIRFPDSVAPGYEVSSSSSAVEQ